MAGFVDKFKRMWDAPDDEYEYDEYGMQMKVQKRTTKKHL